MLDFAEDGEAELTELAPGATVEQEKAACGWNLRVSANVRQATPPGAEVVTMLRETLDPQRLYL